MGAKEKPTYFEHEREYRNQMKAIRQSCGWLGLEMYLPDYHAKHDPNTVLIYTKENAYFNRELEAKCAPFIPRQEDYKPYLFCFQNTDVNGRYDQNFANNGTIDLRGLDYAARINGAIKLAYFKWLQREYVRGSGGYLGIGEADDNYNNMNRMCIEALKEKHGEVWLGNVNYYGEIREGVSAGEQSVFTKWDGSLIYNFEYTIALPRYDEKLVEMIRLWNDANLPKTGKLVEQITDRVDFLGGLNLIWY